VARRIIFITGTDTGVGKTLLTGLLLAHARGQGIQALAMKPFCSGGRGDVELLDTLQDGALKRDLLNPFYFDEPVAPLVSARLHNRNVPLSAAVRAVKAAAQQCELLIVEGSGGLLVPLGEGYFVLDLIRKLNPEVIVASRDRLGTINHTLLTVRALLDAGVREVRTVLMGCRGRDVSRKTNAGLLRELLSPQPLFTLPFLSGNCQSPSVVRRHAKAQARALQKILGPVRSQYVRSTPVRPR
jgi:dethiobiotin synthetase